MHTTLAYVVSLNGKITKGDDPNVHAWSSPEDWEHFVKLRAACDVIVFDRKTYEAVQPKPEQGKLRIVFTSTPKLFSAASLPGLLEFVDTSPAELIKHLAKERHQKVLIAGGARLSSSFLAADLIDDIYVSFEPVLFGTGRPMLSEAPLDVLLQLESVSQLNQQGTLLAHYIIIKAH